MADTNAALEALRELTRGVFPTQLARAGLVPALRSLLARERQHPDAHHRRARRSAVRAQGRGRALLLLRRGARAGPGRSSLRARPSTARTSVLRIDDVDPRRPRPAGDHGPGEAPSAAPSRTEELWLLPVVAGTGVSPGRGVVAGVEPRG